MAGRRGPGGRAGGRRGGRLTPIGALLLAPGAGAGRDHGVLVAIQEEVARLGIAVRRMNFPYRRAGRRSPDRQPVLVGSVREEAVALATESGLEPRRMALGGRSMGGRMCSVAVAEGLEAGALVLVSYPLHPPGEPERRRTEHFGRIEVPCLFLSGTRDAFAGSQELEEATRAIRGAVTHAWVEGADHAMRGRDAEVAERVSAWITSLR
jgi:predicted alpha/beta-hydrolase family hydrolase